MKVGLLQCDHVAPELRGIAGDYDEMFGRWLPVELQTFDLTQGDVPDAEACEAWVVTGSRFSVYDDVPWIHRLAGMVRQIHAGRRPFVGICFGHQMMAHALGGRVVKASRGWSVGVHEFRVMKREPWMAPPLESVALLMSCQDQVEELPHGATVLAANDQCPVAIFRVGSLLGIQGHPEWGVDYAAGLLALRAERVGAERTEAARASFTHERHSAELSRWAMNWMSGAALQSC
jgi:GMP synthase-like glutamine amidotransferase